MGEGGEPAPTEARRVAEAGSAAAGPAELSLLLLQEEESSSLATCSTIRKTPRRYLGASLPS